MMKGSMGKTIQVVSILLLFACTNLSQNIGSSREMDIAKMSWRFGGSDEKDLKRTPKEQLVRFIDQVIQQGQDEYAKERYSPLEKLLIGDYTFKDLDGDGYLEFVASIDVAGRPFFNTVFVTSKAGAHFAYDRVASWGEKHDFSREISDLNKDGILELLAKERWIYPLPEPHWEEAFDKYGGWILADYSWMNIYNWQNGKLTNVSSKFPGYYREKFLPPLEQSIAQIRQFKVASEEDKRSLARHYQVLTFKAQRLLGNRTTGLQEAIAWANSDSQILQENAIRVLREINDAEAIKQLERLAQGKNSGIAQQARDALEVLKGVDR
jgi:hypothetical protein